MAADDPKKWAQRPKILTVTLNAFFFVLRHEGEKEKFKSFRPHILIASIHKRAHSILNAPLFRIQHWYYSFFGRERERVISVVVVVVVVVVVCRRAVCSSVCVLCEKDISFLKEFWNRLFVCPCGLIWLRSSFKTLFFSLHIYT